MPKADVVPRSAISHWGCSCQAFRPGAPTADQAVRALARATNVTIEYVGRDGPELQFVAWTDPEHRYDVVYNPDTHGGWCKHCIAALSHFASWFRVLSLGADDLLVAVHELEKASRKAERRIKTLEREVEKWKKKSKKKK